MMTDIHAKPSRSSSSRTLESASISGKGGMDGVSQAKKRPNEMLSKASGGVAEKKKKDKKKALKRL